MGYGGAVSIYAGRSRYYVVSNLRVFLENVGYFEIHVLKNSAKNFRKKVYLLSFEMRGNIGK